VLVSGSPSLHEESRRSQRLLVEDVKVEYRHTDGPIYARRLDWWTTMTFVTTTSG